MFTKLVPLTTRPWSTSRQGMTRLSSIEQLVALADREAALVQRLARHHPGEVQKPQRAKPAEVLERADAARVEEASPDDPCDPFDLVEVGSLEHPVAVDVRIDELPHPAPLHPLDHVLGPHLGRLRPARHGDTPAADVYRYQDPGRPARDARVEELDVAVGRRPQ